MTLKNHGFCHNSIGYMQEKIEAFLREWQNGEDYIVAHTSGSTGTPKEIHLQKSDMIHSARLTNGFFGITSVSKLYLCLSPDYVAGKMMIVRALEAKAKLFSENPSNRPLSENQSNDVYDLVAVVPSQAQWLVTHPECKHRVRNLLVGGGVLPDKTRLQLAESGIRAYLSYGMTETCSHVALSEIARDKKPFKAMSGIHFEVDNRGCIVIEAPEFTYHRLVTNDIVDLISPTTFFWRGRYDNVINTGGIKVFPEEIEHKIADVLFPKRYYIASRPSDKWGEEVVLIVEGENNDDSKDIFVSIASRLAPFEMPKIIVFSPHFKETASGKIIREKHR